MKAPSFAYAKPRSLAEALELIGRPGAKVLAGGQSLIPSLNLRLSSPELLVDINGLAELKGISLEKDLVRIGALTTHAEIERSEEMKQGVPGADKELKLPERDRPSEKQRASTA